MFIIKMFSKEFANLLKKLLDDSYSV